MIQQIYLLIQVIFNGSAGLTAYFLRFLTQICIDLLEACILKNCNGETNASTARILYFFYKFACSLVFSIQLYWKQMKFFFYTFTLIHKLGRFFDEFHRQFVKNQNRIKCFIKWHSWRFDNNFLYFAIMCRLTRLRSNCVDKLSYMTVI